MNSSDEVLTIGEAASFLKLSDQHVRHLAEAGELPGRKLGDRWRFSRRALLRFLEQPVTPAHPDTVAPLRDDRTLAVSGADGE